MTSKLRILAISLTTIIVLFLGFSSRLGNLFFETTPITRPRARALQFYLESQAGHSDGILMIGILIFVFIAIPIIIKYRDLRSSH